MQVRVAMLSEVPTKLPLTMKAYVLSKDNLNSLEQWHPAHHIVTEGVSGGEVQQTVWCNEGNAGGQQGGGDGGGEGEARGLLGGVADFVFRGGDMFVLADDMRCHFSACHVVYQNRTSSICS